MKIKLKVGKRYVRRDGSISARLEKSTYDNAEVYPFTDTKSITTYMDNGREWTLTDSSADLISEYKTEWSVVIKCKSREDARIIKNSLNGRVFLSDKITVEKSS